MRFGKRTHGWGSDTKGRKAEAAVPPGRGTLAVLAGSRALGPSSSRLCGMQVSHRVKAGPFLYGTFAVKPSAPLPSQDTAGHLFHLERSNQKGSGAGAQQSGGDAKHKMGLRKAQPPEQ